MELHELKAGVYQEIKTVINTHYVNDLYTNDMLADVITLIKNKSYEYVDFRLPCAGEVFVSALDGSITCISTDKFKDPRIILKKIPRRRVIFTDTGEFRRARCGEWFKTETMEYEAYYHCTYNETVSYYKIVTRTEEVV